MSHTFQFWDEKLNKEFTFELSQSLIDCVLNKQWKISKKLGQGSSSAAYEIINLNNNEKAVMTLASMTCQYNSDSNLQKIREYQQQGILDTKYMVKVYEPIYCSVRLSDDPEYPCDDLNPKLIEIIEKVDMTMAEKLLDLFHHGTEMEKVQFILKYKNWLTEALNQGYEYTDVLPDNVGLIGDRFVFIDLESIRYPGRDLTELKFIKNHLDVSEDPGYTREDYIRIGWKFAPTGLARNEEESQRLKQLFDKFDK